MGRSSHGRPIAVLVIFASLAIHGALAALGTSKPPEVTYATTTPAATTGPVVTTTQEVATNVTQTVINGTQEVIEQAQQLVNQTLDNVGSTVNQLEQAICQNGICRFSNGSIFDQTTLVTLPPRPSTTQRPTAATTPRQPVLESGGGGVVVAPSPSLSPSPAKPSASNTPTTPATKPSSPTPFPQETVTVPIDQGGNKGNNAGAVPPQAGVPPGGISGTFPQQEPKEEFNYWPLVWAAVALWSFIVLAIGSALLVQRGRSRPRSESEGQAQV